MKVTDHEEEAASEPEERRSTNKKVQRVALIILGVLAAGIATGGICEAVIGSRRP